MIKRGEKIESLKEGQLKVGLNGEALEKGVKRDIQKKVNDV